MQVRVNMLLLASVLVGCSEPARNRAIVYGQVKIDGQPVEAGSINFMPTSGNTGPTAGGSIEHGSYRIELQKGVVLGKNRVELRANRKTGRKVPSPFGSNDTIDELVDAFPSEYNSNSTLVREISRGENHLDFDLTSKPR